MSQIIHFASSPGSYMFLTLIMFTMLNDQKKNENNNIRPY